MGVERVEIVEEDLGYLEYRIVHEDGSNGSTSLTIRELDYGHHMAYQLRGENLPPGTKIAELFFYPHSETSLRNVGVASRVLDYILKDTAERQIGVVFGEITNLTIKNFCHKKGFKGNYGPHCYTLLEI